MPKGYPKHLPDRPEMPVARREHRGIPILNLATEFDDYWEKNAADKLADLSPLVAAKHAFMDGAMAAAKLFLAGATIHTIQEEVRKFRRTDKARRYRIATTTPQVEK